MGGKSLLQELFLRVHYIPAQGK